MMEVSGGKSPPSFICENPRNLWIKMWLPAGFLENLWMDGEVVVRRFRDWRRFSKRRAVMMEVFGRQEPLSSICENPRNLWIKMWLSAGFPEGERPCEMFALTGGHDYMTNNRS
jgi:hypothetical protein